MYMEIDCTISLVPYNFLFRKVSKREISNYFKLLDQLGFLIWIACKSESKSKTHDKEEFLVGKYSFCIQES